MPNCIEWVSVCLLVKTSNVILSVQRNPMIVREQIQFYDDFILETNLNESDCHEMPGLQNTGGVCPREKTLKRYRSFMQISGNALLLEMDKHRYLSLLLTIKHFWQHSDRLNSKRRTWLRVRHPPVMPTWKHPPDVTAVEPNELESYLPYLSLDWSLARYYPSFFPWNWVMSSPRATDLLTLAGIFVLAESSNDTSIESYYGYLLVRAQFNPSLSDVFSAVAKIYERQLCTLVRFLTERNKNRVRLFRVLFTRGSETSRREDLTVMTSLIGCIISVDWLQRWTRQIDRKRERERNRSRQGQQLEGEEAFSMHSLITLRPSPIVFVFLSSLLSSNRIRCERLVFVFFFVVVVTIII